MAFFQTISRLKLKSVPICDGRIGVLAPTSFNLLSASVWGKFSVVRLRTSATDGSKVVESASKSRFASYALSFKSVNFSLLLLFWFNKSDDDDWFDKFPIFRRRTETSRVSDSTAILKSKTKNEKQKEKQTLWLAPCQLWIILLIICKCCIRKVIFSTSVSPSNFEMSTIEESIWN